jgi:hypothetical protein
MLVTKEANQARYIVKKALNEGLIKKPSNCYGCGNEYDLEAHHKDYSKPLDVEWLCVSCHHSRHGLNNKIMCPQCASRSIYVRTNGDIVCRRCGQITKKVG